VQKNLLDLIAEESLKDLKKALKSVVVQCTAMVQSLADKCEDDAMLAEPADIEDLANRILRRFGLPAREDEDNG
jgi:hypothetical protein